ncbi:hypothetical protein F5B17DRAFT_293280 [Nemania serpens]|nr:hypothetical protein F5B17DRAFT_293280 [Nemania serpens]
MSEYWKSTPKYWCKHCSTYVRDTKLERNNHEATAKHKSALKRFLRDLHRGHENELREKDRAKREIDRLNGITTKPSFSSSSASASASSSSTAAAAGATVAQRQRQWEQLAELGVDVPTELRRDMALAGEWTVTNSRIIDDAPKPEGNDVDAVATGVRKRPKQEDEEDRHDEDRHEEEEGVHGLFKKPRRWGRDTKTAVEDDAELNALLSAPLTSLPKKEEQEEEAKKPGIKDDSTPNIKKEELETDGLSPTITAPAGGEQSAGATVKEEHDEKPDEKPVEPVVVFKKRKPKNIRQK